ncbi:hypothetical protein LJ655_13095 [Paraburkholderia sp. MMS20-SJTN17]|uniref:Uncharacterized protein n=1 Tax=Paraburkholderia translucens TaxID=2886945 RepID=A0ABS8KDR1_9BURK|nr:hypothetical protein [Paraburkholderia sp. MMS20-SJTN17]MCC8402812.1 hypothetical protein [Paraburkholderia sp. MMS20-SJTN17]
MPSSLQFQLRITASAELAASLRLDPSCAAHPALRAILQTHQATLRCQFDAFADYVSEAEKMGTGNYPLYEWTRQTIENPEKKAKYLQSFTLYVNGDEVYDKDVADALEAGLSKLIDTNGILRVSRYDTKSENNPQPPA